jgi:hypothetical protein
MMTDQPYDHLVLEAVRYRRYVGADPEDLRAYLEHRAPRHSGDEDRAALERLEKQGLVVKIGERWFLPPALEAQASGPAFPPTWQSEDSWILLALLYNARRGGASTLASLLPTADVIDQAIPTLAQLHGALNRLASAGLVRALGATYEVTDRARDLLVKAEQACSRGMVKQRDCLRRLLQCPCCGVELESVSWRITLTPADWDAAYARYKAGPDPSRELTPSGRQLTPSGRRQTLTGVRPKPVCSRLSVLLAAVNLAIPLLADRLSVSLLASKSEAAHRQSALVASLGFLALMTLFIAWIALVGHALRRREGRPWLLALALIMNIGAIYLWVGKSS